MAEQADARDLKSLDVTVVSVQVRSAAPKHPFSGVFLLKKPVLKILKFPNRDLNSEKLGVKLGIKLGGEKLKIVDKFCDFREL